jgi:LCP family protein required for cell wall assembly
MVSFPRDLEVHRPACPRWDARSGKYSSQMAPEAEHAKLNSVYAEGGPKCMTRVIQELSGLALNHFTGIDFSGFKGMVDAVRGVEVCTTEPLKDQVLGTVLPKAGRQTISGDTALNYVRARHVVGDPTADYGRIERQQRFLSSLLRKAMSQDVLFNPARLNGFVNAVARATYGENMDVDQLLLLAQSLQDLNTGKVTFVTVPTVGYSNERGNEVLRVGETNQLFKAIIGNTPLPGEQHSAKPQGSKPQAQPLPAVSDAVKPSDIKIQVLNAGNTKDGIATTTANALGEQGFQVVQTENAPDKVSQTVIRYSAASEAKAKTLAKSVPSAKLERDPSVAGAVILMIGPDFDGNVSGDGSGSASSGDTAPPDVSTVNGADNSCS